MTNTLKNPKVSQVLKMPNSKDNFGLTKHEFDHFVAKVKEGDESLFIQVFNVHFKSSVRYIQNKFNIPEEAAYDICMDTMIEFRSKLKSGKINYGNIRFLYTKMAVHKYLDDLKRKNQINEAIVIFIGDRKKINFTDSEFLMILNRSIERLEFAQRHMIKEIFYSGKEVDQILAENQITYSTFRKRKQRSLDKLKTTFLELLKKSK
jgi:DNA-directed RNA polymerase specialized sigma24 family protein